MKYNPTTCPGPGDAVTWPAYSGNPNDPRAEEDPEWDGEWEQLCDAAKREALTELSKDELIAHAIDDAHEIYRLKCRVHGLEAKLRGKHGA